MILHIVIELGAAALSGLATDDADGTDG